MRREEMMAWMQLNVKALAPEYNVINRSYLEALEDETEARME
jgi:hypothetical protein